jgi:hypothetical protein
VPRWHTTDAVSLERLCIGRGTTRTVQRDFLRTECPGSRSMRTKAAVGRVAMDSPGSTKRNMVLELMRELHVGVVVFLLRDTDCGRTLSSLLLRSPAPTALRGAVHANDRSRTWPPALPAEELLEEAA